MNRLVELNGMLVTNPARTALDLARHLPRGIAVANLDALSSATGVTAAEVTPLIGRYKGARGVRECLAALSLMDGGLPRPVTQIRVTDGQLVAYLDMGWKEPKVAVEYDGDQHRNDRRQYVKDIRRAEMVDRQDWRVVKVINEDRPNVIVQRARDALARRSAPRLP